MVTVKMQLMSNKSDSMMVMLNVFSFLRDKLDSKGSYVNRSQVTKILHKINITIGNVNSNILYD